MTDQLRVYFHYRSPYSRLALHQLQEADITTRIDTKLYVLSRSAGEDKGPDPTRTPARMNYIMQDVPRMTALTGLRVRPPRAIDIDWTTAHQHFYGLGDAGDQLRFATALSNARWGNGKDISETDVIDAVLKETGLPCAPIEASEVKSRLRRDQEMVEKDLIFGVPFAILDRDGQKEPFFGQDRIGLLLERIV
ncbi:MAG: DsbA family protein [Pseudomonadota bacterium]